MDVRGHFSRVLARDEIYLANHSLGRPPDRAADDVAEAMRLWYENMDSAWGAWLDESRKWRTNVACLLGYQDGSSTVPKTSAGQGLRAVLNAFPSDRPVRVLTTTGEFDSIDHILKAYATQGRAQVHWVHPRASDQGVPLFEVEPLVEALPQGFDLVVVSLVFFGTGQVLQDVEALISAAHRCGARVLLDVYHAAGVLPLSLEALSADFAIGGSYKYLRGGPGACFLAVHPSVLESGLRTLDTGWFAKRDVFSYRRPERPEYAIGGDAWLESTPPVLMPYQAKAGLEFTLDVGVPRLREQNLAAQQAMRDAFRAAGVALFEPSNPTGFGAFSLYPCEDPSRVSEALRARGVNSDARGAFVRFGPDILNTPEEFARAAEILAEVVGGRSA